MIILLFVYFSQQREERTKKRRRGYRAFGFVAMVAVGVCGTRFVRTVLAHFSSVSLATSPPDKGGDLICAFDGLFNPSVLADTSPIFCATKHRGGGGDVFSFCLNFGEKRHNGRRDCVFLFRDMRVISSIV